MKSRRDVFQALADPTKRAIVLLVASSFNLPRPTVSKHLQILSKCELLKPKQNGREIY
jgi:DNA-binding transcriptional ArsR family regulator